MNKYIKTLFYILLILVPSVFVFFPFFKSLNLALGDAPYFYPEGLKNLVSGLPMWSNMGINFGGKNLALWLSPIMMVYGSLNKYFGLENDAIIRIVFYFPSVILSVLGPYFLAKYLKFSKNVQFFSSLFYLLNTYFILLIDGGQVGIALAYGIFPFVILFWKKFLDNLSLKAFAHAFFATFILCYIDPRIVILSFLTIFLWQILEGIIEKKFARIMNLLWVVLAGIFLIPVNAFWLLPLIKGGNGAINTFVSDLQLSSLLNSLLLFAPHWPSNIFGKVISPYFYFSFVPILIFGQFMTKEVNKKNFIFVFIFIFFAFLAKGSTPPLGTWYEFFVNRIPFGSMFRDSSKFFIPMLLMGGILIGNTLDAFLGRFRGKTFKMAMFGVFYVYILLLIYPALAGKLNFNLSSKIESADYQIIHDHLISDDSSFRTLWFSKKPQTGFEILTKPALNADQLTISRPFASMNEGEDVFNFLNNTNYVDWLRIFGIKYIILSGDPRNINPTEKDIKNWSDITNLISQSPGLTKENWGTSIPVYKVEGYRPEAYSIDKLTLVVGPDLVPNRQILLAVYAEDGKFDPKVLENVSPDSLRIVLNRGSINDLAMSFLQKYFKSVKNNDNSQWAVFGSDQYLKYKYELLTRDFKFNDFDYGQGMAFSTKEGENIKYIFDIPVDGKYIVAKRFATDDDQKLRWIIESKTIKAGKFEYEIINQSSLSVLNTVAVIPEEEFNKSIKLAGSFISTFGITTTINLSSSDWHEATVKNVDGLKHTYSVDGKDHWLIFTQNYDTNWKSDGLGVNLPVFSTINGFYLGKHGEISVEYAGQKYLKLGAKISLGSILVFVVSYLAYEIYDYRRRHNQKIRH